MLLPVMSCSTLLTNHLISLTSNAKCLHMSPLLSEHGSQLYCFPNKSCAGQIECSFLYKETTSDWLITFPNHLINSDWVSFLRTILILFLLIDKSIITCRHRYSFLVRYFLCSYHLVFVVVKNGDKN